MIDGDGELRLDAKVGGRAPHVWLADADGERTSIIDLLSDEFTLIVAGPAEPWLDEIPNGERDGVIALAVEPAALDAYGINEGGAVLVRPDGHIAWRSPTLRTDSALNLRRALEVATGRDLC